MSSLQSFIDGNPALAALVQSPVLAAIVQPIAVAIPMAFLLGFAGMGFLVGTLEFLGVSRGRSAYDKCARQLAVCALILGWIMLVGIRIWIFFNSDSYVPQSFLGMIVELSWAALGFAIVTASLHFALWKLMVNHRIIHGSLAILIGINGIIAVTALLGSLRMLTALDLPNATELTLWDLFNFTVFPSPFLDSAMHVIPLCLAMPAAAAAVWLVLRRRRDDYGRDYYNNMVPWCCRWALGFWILATVVTGLCVGSDIWAMTSGGTFVPTIQECAVYAVRFLPPVIACILWAVASRSATPMRHKTALVLAFFLCMPAGYFLYMNATSFVF